MDKQEFYDFQEYVLDRWPAVSTWDTSVWLAYYAEIEHFDSSVVFEAVTRYFRKGSAYAPQSSEIVSRCNEILRYESRPALEANTQSNTVTWEQVSMKMFGEHISLVEASERLAQQREKGYDHGNDHED